MMTAPRQQRGISLIVAIVIVVFLSLIATFLVRSVGSQQALNTQSLIGQRAFYAARAGLEWGAAQALPPNNTCAAGNNLLIEGVAVVVGCSSIDVTEANVTYQVFRIDAQAQSGILGNPEFAQRRLSVRLSNKP
jgi:MSHA biogenesis protein MshP